MNKPTTTCQICGRPILANTGLIAHHGYQRPGDGYQTKSCMGAKYLPYEVSCNRIQVAIDDISAYKAGTMDRLADWIKNPPQTIIDYKKDFYTGKTTELKYERPADFTIDSYASIPRTYACEHSHRKYAMQRTIKACTEQLAYLTDRLQKWVAPQGVQA